MHIGSPNPQLDWIKGVKEGVPASPSSLPYPLAFILLALVLTYL